MNRRGSLGLRGRSLALIVAFSLAPGLSLPAARAQTRPVPPVEPPRALPPPQENGLAIYQRFREGLAAPQCEAAATGPRWKQQFAHAPKQLATSDDVLPLFGYVVDALRQANLPTEFALIPFVESGYKPAARNADGPAGLWQFINITARSHGVAIHPHYDGRLSPVDSTQAAVRYLKTLHGMFGGDWRLAVMAYNAGEYRILQSMRRAGMNAHNARPAELPGLSRITYAYVEKLHALSCIFEQANDRGEWLKHLDRPVPRLSAHTLPRQTDSLATWADHNGLDSDWLKRLNPALGNNIPQLERPVRILAPAIPEGSVRMASSLAANTLRDDDGNTRAPSASSASPRDTPPVAPPLAGSPAAPHTERTPSPVARSHTVRNGESLWGIARRYGLKPQQLQVRNQLKPGATLRPGMVLALDESTP